MRKYFPLDKQREIELEYSLVHSIKSYKDKYLVEFERNELYLLFTIFNERVIEAIEDGMDISSAQRFRKKILKKMIDKLYPK